MRGKQAPKREIVGDPKYNDIEIAKFINYLMKDGKKTTAERILYDCFDILKEETKQDPRHIFNKGLKMICPLVEIRGRRVGGANYQVPHQVRGERRFTLGCRWLLTASRARKGHSMAEKLAAEILDSIKGESASIKKKLDVHRMAEANKAFAHFARH
jgi:small subunit ribosomal protein S7